MFCDAMYVLSEESEQAGCESDRRRGMPSRAGTKSRNQRSERISQIAVRCYIKAGCQIVVGYNTRILYRMV